MAIHSVLVVEDEDNIAAALEFLITREGYVHDRVASGSAALPRIRDMHPDLVLLDVMLPEVSGYDICQSIRRDPTLAAVKEPPSSPKPSRSIRSPRSIGC